MGKQNRSLKAFSCGPVSKNSVHGAACLCVVLLHFGEINSFGSVSTFCMYVYVCVYVNAFVRRVKESTHRVYCEYSNNHKNEDCVLAVSSETLGHYNCIVIASVSPNAFFGECV